MIGLSILGASIFSISNAIYYAAFNVLIKILEDSSTSDPNIGGMSSMSLL